jgi:hypothetical protein
VAELLWSNSTSSADLLRSRWTDYEDDEGPSASNSPDHRAASASLDRVTVGRDQDERLIAGPCGGVTTATRAAPADLGSTFQKR